MKSILGLLIFLIVLFLYLHIHYHLKVSNDLEVYDMLDEPCKEKLEEMCEYRQPVRMNMRNDELMNILEMNNLTNTYSAFDVNIRNVKRTVNDDEQLHVPVRLEHALRVIRNDKDAKYILECNSDFLSETGIQKTYRNTDALLRPYMLAGCKYDYLVGSQGAQTPFRYDIHFRNYIYVVSGTVRIKLSSPKNSKYLELNKDYEHFEFRTPINPWNVQDIYKRNFDKVKCLEVELTKGQLLFIPAYWWNSLEFGENTVISTFKYDSYMSYVATCHNYLINFLQLQNIKRDSNLKIKQSDNINDEIHSHDSGKQDDSIKQDDRDKQYDSIEQEESS